MQLGTKSNDISFLLLLFLPYSKCNYAGNSNNNSCVQLERGFAKHEVERTAIYTFRGLTTNWRNKYDPSAEYCTGEEGRGWWVDNKHAPVVYHHHMTVDDLHVRLQLIRSQAGEGGQVRLGEYLYGMKMCNIRWGSAVLTTARIPTVLPSVRPLANCNFTNLHFII